MESDSSLSDLSSSDLSSVGSLSPIPDYPSPTLTQDTENSDPNSSQNKKRGSDSEEQQPPKKRKRPEPKPRTTDTLDLTNDLTNLATEQKNALDKLLQVLRKRRKIVVIAGAGISVSAGIPDFRSSTGLFKTLKGEHKLKASGKQLFDASVYQTDSSTSTFHDMVRQLSEQVSKAKPTDFHQMLATLSTEDRLMRLYTQNVDGLDVQLPLLETEVPLNRKGPWPKTIQVHGGLEKMACSKCSAIYDFESALFNGPDPPPCPKCVEADRIRTDHAGKRSHGVGRLRPRMALYNERTPDEDAIGAVMAADLRARPDALIVVGTSLKIPGVKRLVREMCGVIRDRRDGLTIWMNMDPPPMGKEFENCWDLVVTGPCDEVSNQWKKSYCTPQSGSDTEKEKNSSDKKSKKSKKKKTDNEAAAPLPTPVASPMASDNEGKTRIKLHVSASKITSSISTEAKEAKVKVVKAKKVKSAKSQEKAKKPKPGADLSTKFKVVKPAVSKSKGLITQKEPDSSPLSSPQLPAYGLPFSPRTPSKSALNKATFFPGLIKYSPKKYHKSLIEQGKAFWTPLTPPTGLDLRSSPPPHEPLSSPVKGYAARETRIPKISTIPTRPTHSLSRPGSSSSQETVSPTSIPRGMAGLID